MIMADSRGFVPVLRDRGGARADPARGPAADAGPARRNALRPGYPAPRLMCRAAGGPFKHDIQLQRRPQTNTDVIIHNRDIRQLRSNRPIGPERTCAAGC